MWELLEHVLLHAVIDSLKLLPFLFLAYLLIEYIEHRASDRFQRFLNGSGKFGPLGGAVVGLIPQCGFSGAAANLYSCRVITVGTLAAVFLATSDEAIPVLLANPEHIGDVGALLLCKVVIAVLAGFLLDFAQLFLHIHVVCILLLFGKEKAPSAKGRGRFSSWYHPNLPHAHTAQGL